MILIDISLHFSKRKSKILKKTKKCIAISKNKCRKILNGMTTVGNIIVMTRKVPKGNENET